MGLLPKRQMFLISSAAAASAARGAGATGAAGMGVSRMMGGSCATTTTAMMMSSRVGAAFVSHSSSSSSSSPCPSCAHRHNRKPVSGWANHATRRHHVASGRRLYSDIGGGTTTTTVAGAPVVVADLPDKTGDRNGLIRHGVIADDGHPLRVYSRAPRPRPDDNADADVADPLLGRRGHGRSILLLHGRTWSSQPVFDLRTSDDDEKHQSTLQSLADLGFHAYAMDFRGFGETPRDGSGYTTPRRCVADVERVIDWIAEKHCQDGGGGAKGRTDRGSHMDAFEDPTVIDTRPALLGWSQGALVAQLYAQRHGQSTLSDLILFGSIYDPRVIYSRKPLYDPMGRLVSSDAPGSQSYKPPAPEVPNTDVASLEDFTLPGTICDEAALTFSKLALAVDAIKAPWDELHQFNALNPALVHVPTLVIVGAQDPYVSWEAQRELFERLGTEDRAMCVLPGCDHAAHILKARKMFVRGVTGFLLRKDQWF